MENLNAAESQKKLIWPIILRTFTEKQSKQVMEALNELPEGEMKKNLLEECLKKEWKSKENYESLKPTGFDEYAPLSVKFYWASLEEDEEVKQMEHFKKNISYIGNGKIRLSLLNIDIDENLMNKLNQKDCTKDERKLSYKILKIFYPLDCGAFNPNNGLSVVSASECLEDMTWYTLE